MVLVTYGSSGKGQSGNCIAISVSDLRYSYHASTDLLMAHLALLSSSFGARARARRRESQKTDTTALSLALSLDDPSLSFTIPFGWGWAGLSNTYWKSKEPGHTSRHKYQHHLLYNIPSIAVRRSTQRDSRAYGSSRNSNPALVPQHANLASSVSCHGSPFRVRGFELTR